jgi:GTPase
MAGSYKSGFVNIFGAPNAGKSTLLNLLLGERLVITSPKVQTTRHRILGILSEPTYQIVFSDTPGVMEPKYKLHHKMMQQVKSALEDADIAIMMHDISRPLEEFEMIVNTLKLKVPALLLLNKIDALKDKSTLDGIVKQFQEKYPNWAVLPVSARKKTNTEKILPLILNALPEGMPFYPDDSISDRNDRFFVAEMIREQIYALYDEEIPYHAAVLIQSFEEKTNVNVIKADIIVSRETQKMILLGKGGSMIKQLGINARLAMEEFLQKKVHLELFVKVRPKWRDNENYLREYGYN